ncbi:MAG: sulfite exporter TauE/SafE family protein [Corynebacterium sp.]|nr:sulfite exporter TauE/SafE family protein [Corynebacterium sp.]
MTIITVALAGLFVGLIVGLLGAGGGILAVPALIYLLGFDEHTATGSSLVIILFTALVALPGKIATGKIQWKVALQFATCACVGAIGGRILNALLDANALMWGFSLFLFAVGTWMLHRTLRVETKTRSIPSIWLIPVALVTGLLTGIFGVSGGFFVVPVLVLLFGLSMAQAAASSIVIMIITAVVALVTTLLQGAIVVPWGSLMIFAIASAVGSAIGSPFSARCNERLLQILFLILIFGVATYTLVSLVLYSSSMR